MNLSFITGEELLWLLGPEICMMEDFLLRVSWQNADILLCMEHFVHVDVLGVSSSANGDIPADGIPYSFESNSQETYQQSGQDCDKVTKLQNVR